MKSNSVHIPEDFGIRWMVRRDMPEVLFIDRHSFEWSWTEDEFIFHLRKMNTIGMVVDVGESVAGFMLYELHQTKLHLIRFAVHEQYRRLGAGRAMICKLQNKLSLQRRNRIVTEVAETNTPAVRFYSSQGFRAARLLPGYYPLDDCDGYRMVYRMAPGRDSLAVLQDRFSLLSPPQSLG